MVEALVEKVVDVGSSALLVHHVGCDKTVGLQVSHLFVRLVLGMLCRPCVQTPGSIKAMSIIGT